MDEMLNYLFKKDHYGHGPIIDRHAYKFNNCCQNNAFVCIKSVLEYWLTLPIHVSELRPFELQAYISNRKAWLILHSILTYLYSIVYRNIPAWYSCDDYVCA